MRKDQKNLLTIACFVLCVVLCMNNETVVGLLCLVAVGMFPTIDVEHVAVNPINAEFNTNTITNNDIHVVDDIFDAYTKCISGITEDYKDKVRESFRSCAAEEDQNSVMLEALLACGFLTRQDGRLIQTRKMINQFNKAERSDGYGYFHTEFTNLSF